MNKYAGVLGYSELCLRNVKTQNELRLEKNGRELKRLYFHYILGKRNKKGIAAVFGTDGLMISDAKEKTKQFYFSLPKRKIFRLEMINQIKQSGEQLNGKTI